MMLSTTKKKNKGDYPDSEVSILIDNFNLADLTRLKRLMTQKVNQTRANSEISEQKKLELSMKAAILDLALAAKATMVARAWWHPKKTRSKYLLDKFQMKMG